MINLRKATIGDIEILLSIEKSLLNSKTYSAMATEGEWKEELSKSTVYVIEKDGIAVGDISYELKENGHAHISGLAIMPDFQGQGIGREALTKILEELNGFKLIDLAVHHENVSALKLYESFGFVAKERIENFYGDGEPRSIMVLER